MAESIRRTESLRQSHPEIDFPASIYSVDDRRNIYSTDPSIAGASELEFEFDDLIVNSKVYRRVLASARGKALDSDRHVIEGDLIRAWQGGSARPQVGSGFPALDMLDLTSILESSQVMSSVLQVDQLLETMCEIILQNCRGLATLAAIVVEEDDPVCWSIAASGDPEKGAEAHIPGIPLGETALVAEGVILYCTRFQETVFLPDLIHDERFSNVSEAWSTRNPKGKSVIAIPICPSGKPLLGVLYLEGEPNAFTDRSLTVLQLLVNQIGISY
jgi:GAF domain-containing protein